MEDLRAAILEAWRTAERELADEPPFTRHAARLEARIRLLRQAHALATDPVAHNQRAVVARLLVDNGAGDVLDPLREPPSRS